MLAARQSRPLGPLLAPAIPDAELHTAIASVHRWPYLDFLAHAWDAWVAMDPANAERDALPSVWPLPSRHGFRTDVAPRNFAAQLGLYAFDSGSPLMAGTWAAARTGAGCALATALVVPMGLDTFAGDPIPGFQLQSADYFAVGQALAGAGLPTVFTFEGGYAVAEVGTNAVNLLEGFAREAG